MSSEVEVATTRSGDRGRAAWTLAAVAAGGAAGAVARYGTSTLWSSPPGAFPWATLLVNVAGCLTMGALMTVLAAPSAHRLLRPFLGVGVLGGFTTFSTYVTDALTLFATDRAAQAVVYALGTLLGALAATLAGMLAARLLLGRAGAR